MALEQTETIAGSVVPNRSVDVMSELPKKVVSVLFKDGSYVSRGQALYKLDDADTRAKLRQFPRSQPADWIFPGQKLRVPR